jgi:hypothetical protein
MSDKTVWDPFSRSRPNTVEQVAAAGGITVPPWASTASVIAVLVGFVILFAQIIFGAFPLVGGIITTLGFIGVFGLDSLGNRTGKQDSTNADLATAHGWAYTPTKRRKRVSGRTPGLNIGPASDQINNAMIDPKARPAYDAIPEILNPSFSHVMPLDPEAFFWGNTDGTDFWLGTMQVEAVSMSGGGEWVQIVVGVPLANPMGTRAVIQPKDKVTDRWSHIATGDDAFDAVLSVALDRQADASSTGENAVLNRLSEEVRTAMIDQTVRAKSRYLLTDTAAFATAELRVDKNHDYATTLKREVSAAVAVLARM